MGEPLSLDSLLLNLMKSNEPSHNCVAYQLLRWIADIIDFHPYWSGVSDDPLSLPISRGEKRARAVHPAIINAVVRETSKGKLGKSGQVIANNLIRFRFKPGAIISAKAANNWADVAGAAAAWARWEYLQTFVPTYYSVCADATRLGGLDTLWLALNYPEYDTSAWMPQQAPT